MKFWIRTALKTFGDLSGSEWEEIRADSFEDAVAIAEDYAEQEYDQYAGVIGLRTLDQIMAEEMVTLADAEGIYNKERQSEILHEVTTTDPKIIDAVESGIISAWSDELDWGERTDDDLRHVHSNTSSDRYGFGYLGGGDYGDLFAGSSYTDPHDDSDDFTPEIEAEIRAEEAVAK